MAGSTNQAVEHLPSKHKALSSNPITKKEGRKEGRKGEREGEREEGRKKENAGRKEEKEEKEMPA
jgi:hypothetical protein